MVWNGQYAHCAAATPPIWEVHALHDAKNAIAFRHLVSGPEGRPNGTATLPFFLAGPRGSTKSPLS